MYESNDYDTLPASQIISELGKSFKRYRLYARMTQAEVSKQSGTNLTTIKLFENGRLHNITMVSLISLMKAVGQANDIKNLLPEMPPSPYLIEKMQKKEKRRVRHGKNNNSIRQ